MRHPLIIAHRGASRDAPENTIAAFELAWEQGADAIETDLRLTADGAIVAIHDADGQRTLGNPRRVRDLPLSALRSLDAGEWKHPRWRGERVPLLHEVLSTVPPGKQAVLELKEDLVAELSHAIPAAERGRVTLIAFDAAIIAKAKRTLPECRTLWLFSDYASVPSRHRGVHLADRVRELGIDGVDLRHDFRLTPALLAPLRAEERIIFTYTVNHSASIRRCARLGLDGLTTDRPAAARRWLGIST
jgi:glycerophosphoryl diester phosphodiesterase